jgi:hypothetical protein
LRSGFLTIRTHFRLPTSSLHRLRGGAIRIWFVVSGICSFLGPFGILVALDLAERALEDHRT